MAEHAPSYVIDGLEPREVARPGSPEEVAAVLKRAAAEGMAVIPWGAGTKQGFGNRPRAYDLALDLTGLDALLEYEPADLVVTAQAGIPLRVLQQRLAEAGQFLALDPPYAAAATLGGTLATNVSGPSRLLYGTGRDLVLGMRVATTDGEVVKSGGKVVKNVVGYDLHKMHIGGLGTLGVIVEVTLKVHPLPKAQATVGATFASPDAAQEASGRLFRSALYPRAVELARATLPGREGDPTSGAWRVLMWAAGSPATVARQARNAAQWLAEAGAGDVATLEGEAHERLWQAVREFGRGPRAAPAQHTLVKLTCLPSDVTRLVGAIDAATAAAAVPSAEVVAHAGSGVVYALLPQATADLLRALARIAAEHGGAAVVEEAPWEVKAEIDVWGPTRDDFPLMQALKAQFDPQGILNPGRFVGGI
jgi:glycolate oxidase FAD binding subunit